MVNTNTETAINNQFIAIFIVSAQAGSIMAAAAIVISPNIASVPDSRRFALNPPETPANAAAKPANGCLPRAAKISAPSGGNTTYPASDATLDIIPAKTNPNVINLFGTDNTNPLRSALISPVRSATPIPNIVNNTTPSGAKPIKLLVIFVKIYCIPSALKRFFISTVVPSSPGCSTLIPSGCKAAESKITNSAKIANNVAGWGSLLPTSSILSKEI